MNASLEEHDRRELEQLRKTRAEVWENPEQWMRWCDHRVLERAEAAELALRQTEVQVEMLKHMLHEARTALAVRGVVAEE